jgi:hypothetical protein
MNTSLAFSGSGTAAAALAFGLFITPQTVINTSGSSLVKTLPKNSTVSTVNDRRSLTGTFDPPTVTPLSDHWFDEVSERQTSQTEKTVGELRRWLTLAPSWDGEGANAPIPLSVESASDFIRLLPENVANAEPMLHANGLAGLFWNENGHYADLEFLGDGRIAYFIQRDDDKHKGVVHFGGKIVPPFLFALLETPRVS